MADDKIHRKDAWNEWTSSPSNTHSPGSHWYPLNIPSNWSSNAGWEHDANNHIYIDDVEIYSDAPSGGPAIGSMADGSARLP